MYVCRRARSYLRVSDVTAAEGGVGVAMGDDDYVIVNGDLSYYAPPETDAVMAGGGVGAPARRCPWLRTLDAAQRAVFVQLDAALRRRFDVTMTSVHVTSSAAGGSRRRSSSSSKVRDRALRRTVIAEASVA